MKELQKAQNTHFQLSGDTPVCQGNAKKILVFPGTIFL